MNYVIMNAAYEDNRPLALFQGPENVDWNSLYREFAEQSGLGYEVARDAIRITPGGTNRRFFDNNVNADHFLNWLAGKPDFHRLPFQEQQLV